MAKGEGTPFSKIIRMVIGHERYIVNYWKVHQIRCCKDRQICKPKIKEG